MALTKPMRALHVCLRYPPALGGVERYVHDLVEHTRASEAALDVRVLTSRLRTHGPVEELAPEQLLNDPAYVQRLHHRTTPLLSYPRLQALPYYLAHHQPDIIHGYSFWYQPADVVARYAHRHGLPFIFHPMFYRNAVRKKPIWQVYQRLIGQRTMAAADVVAVLSPYEQHLIEHSGLPVRRFVLLPPGIDVEQFTFNVQPPDPFLPHTITGTILLSVGRLSHEKAYGEVFEQLPTLLKQFPDLQYVLVGDDFGAQADLKELAEQLGISTHVHFLGSVSDEQLRAAYHHADIFVHPSRYEAFGIVLAEAQAAGLPVIARNVAAVPYVVRHNKSGLLFNSGEELQQHLTSLLKNTALRQEMGTVGREYITATFAHPVLVKKVLGLYEELKTK